MMEGQLISRAIETRVTPIWKSTWHSHYGITIKVFRARSREVRNHFFSSFVLFFYDVLVSFKAMVLSNVELQSVSLIVHYRWALAIQHRLTPI